MSVAKMSRRKLAYGAIAVAVILVAGGLGYYYLMPPSPVPPKELIKFQYQLGWIAEYPNRIGLWVAKEKGFYAEEGFDVEFLSGKGSGYSMQVLAGRKAPMADAGGAAILNMITQNKTDLIVVWAQMVVNPTVLFTKPDSGIKSLKDLEGKKVGVITYSVNHANYLAMIGKAGVDRRKITELPQGFDPCTPLVAGQMDVTIGYMDDAATCEEKGIKLNKFRAIDYGVEGYTNLFATHRDYYEKNKDLIRRFIRATTKGYLYALDRPDEAVEIFSKLFPQTPKSRIKIVMDYMKEEMINDATKKNGLGWMDEKVWDYSQDMYHRYGYIKQRVESLKNLFTNEFVYKP